ncbi:hypothetical protein JHK82_023599 [Glycine max]|nr:hypothetical protein JHK85_024156 [Glycine max]KAG5011400.1 hypothetical protein JHK86_023661 [Glycine max]KAG5132411.1 hypothetical protein JHK82_023599 [Glycine max]
MEKGRILTLLLVLTRSLSDALSCVVVLDALQQTLDLIQQERVGLSAKLSEKRAYYSKVAEDMNAKLQKQQVTGKAVGQKSKVEGMALNFSGSDVRKDLIIKLDNAKARLDGILALKAKVLTENNKVTYLHHF